MDNKNLLSEHILNEIFIAFQYGRDFCKPSKELITALAASSGFTELVLQEHLKIIAQLYNDGKIDKKILTPHLEIKE